MASPVNFEGQNVIYKSPPGEEDRVQPLHVMTNGRFVTSCWELSPEEIAEVSQTGRIFLTVINCDVFPSFVGGEASTRGITADCGKPLPKQNQEKEQA